MPDINLLENQLQADSNIKNKKIFKQAKLGLIVLLVLVLAAASGLLVTNVAAQKSQAAVTGSLENKKSQLEDTALEQRSKVVAVQGQVQYADQLLIEHTYWTKLFDLLNSVSVDGVRLTSLNAAAAGNVSLSASAPDLPAIAAYIKNLQAVKGFTQVVLNSSALSGEGQGSFFQFTASITFDSTVLKFKN